MSAAERGSKQMSVLCEGTNERRSEWPSTLCVDFISFQPSAKKEGDKSAVANYADLDETQRETKSSSAFSLTWTADSLFGPLTLEFGKYCNVLFPVFRCAAASLQGDVSVRPSVCNAFSAS